MPLRKARRIGHRIPSFQDMVAPVIHIPGLQMHKKGHGVLNRGIPHFSQHIRPVFQRHLPPFDTVRSAEFPSKGPVPNTHRLVPKGDDIFITGIGGRNGAAGGITGCSGQGDPSRKSTAGQNDCHL